MGGEWSVDKVLKVIIINCRSWHGKGIKVNIMKMSVPSIVEVIS